MFNIRKKSNRKTLYIFDKIPIFSYRIDANNKIMLKRFLHNFIFNLICCFVPFKKIRKKIRLKTKHYNSVIINKINYKRSQKPIEPYAYIRVCNEIETIDACLNSILPVIKKGVIGYNDCDDGSEEYILEFCKNNRGFIPYKYPYKVFNFTDPRLFDKNCKEENKFFHYSNEVLKLIPKNEWIIKIDCDHIFDKEKLKNLMYLPADNNDAIIMARLNLHYDGKNLYFIKDCPILTTEDHWIIYNNNLEFVPMLCNKATMIEYLDISSRKLIYSEVSNYHFPLIKKRRNSFDMNNLIEFNKFISDGLLEKYIKDNNLPVIIDDSLIKNIASNSNMQRIKIN